MSKKVELVFKCFNIYTCTKVILGEVSPLARSCKWCGYRIPKFKLSFKVMSESYCNHLSTQTVCKTCTIVNFRDVMVKAIQHGNIPSLQTMHYESPFKKEVEAIVNSIKDYS